MQTSERGSCRLTEDSGASKVERQSEHSVLAAGRSEPSMAHADPKLTRSPVALVGQQQRAAAANNRSEHGVFPHQGRNNCSISVSS